MFWCFFFKCFDFWPQVTHGLLVLRPEIEPAPPVLEVWSLNHWTTREVLRVI